MDKRKDFQKKKIQEESLSDLDMVELKSKEAKKLKKQKTCYRCNPQKKGKSEYLRYCYNPFV